jgi:Asp-tRNA(Asn)/Glu-tRNA(Gln) amidotransferase A subunit family amidase
MVPLALGSQTNGSVIRPASYCGVHGFKPSHGLIPRSGILKLSRTLDHVGMFARTIDDLALLAELLVGWDADDPDTRPRATMPFVEIAAQEPPLRPLLGFVKPPVWDRVEADTRQAFAELSEELKDCLVQIELPASTAEALDWHRTIMEAEMAANLDREFERGADQLSESLRSQLARGRELRVLDYQRAVARIPLLNSAFDGIFERCDALITPPAAGTAPKGLASTGDPSFCTLWTLCGMPALNLPMMQGENGLPLGIQLVGQRGADTRLLRTAKWLLSRLNSKD